MVAPILPPEVLAHIITFMSSPADLFSVCLANHMLSALAIPELDYRFIRCRLGNNALWRYLIAHPTLASRVRKLEVIRQNRPPGYQRLDMNEWVPDDPSYQSTPDAGQGIWFSLNEVEQSEKLLIEALHVLVNLEQFIWDRWVPVINQGKAVPLELLEAENKHSSNAKDYKEDIWTVLRDHTQLRELKVVDLGRHNVPSTFGHVCSVYESTMFTIVNLTSLELKIYYVPQDETMVAAVLAMGNIDNNDNVLRGCVDISPLREFLLRCLNLQHLNLTIKNRSFYRALNESSLADLTPLFTSASWPRLSSLCLYDIFISSTTATHFLAIHPSLRALTAHLLLSSPGMPTLPFTLDIDTLNATRPGKRFLPELEEVDLPPELARIVLNALVNLGGVKVVRGLEPCDWGVVSESDNSWATESSGEAVPEVNVDAEMNLIQRLTGLRDFTPRNMWNFVQLGKLVDAAPQLEILRMLGSTGNTPSLPRSGWNSLRDELLPHLSRLRRLTIFTGIPLWEETSISYEWEYEVVHELGEACPLLKEVTWNGEPGLLVRNERGEGIRVDPKWGEGWDENYY